MNWSLFLEKGNISLKLLLTIAVLSGCLIFLPDNIKTLLSVNLFANKYKEFIGPSFLVSTVLVSLGFFQFVYNKFNRKIQFNHIEKQIKENLKSLTYQEKSVLREFYLLGCDTLAMPLQNPTIAGLIAKRIIYQVGSFGGISYREPCLNYSLTTVAKKNINPNFIDFPLTQSDENIKYLKNHRPEWMQSNSYY